jgi:hypothetical protein
VDLLIEAQAQQKWLEYQVADEQARKIMDLYYKDTRLRFASGQVSECPGRHFGGQDRLPASFKGSAVRGLASPHRETNGALNRPGESGDQRPHGWRRHEPRSRGC